MEPGLDVVVSRDPQCAVAQRAGSGENPWCKQIWEPNSLRSVRRLLLWTNVYRVIKFAVVHRITPD